MGRNKAVPAAPPHYQESGVVIMERRVFMLSYLSSSQIVDMTQHALDRILGSTGEETGVTHLINGGTMFSVKAHDRLKAIYSSSRLHLGHAYNALVNATSEEFICLVHNDCFVPETDWLSPLCNTAREHGFAFPKVEVDWDDCRERGVNDLGRLRETLPPSCCYVISRGAWKTLGGFSPEYQGCHFEDTDLFMRGIRAGYKMAVVPEVSVEHRRGVTRAETATESNYGFVRNREIYMAKWVQPDGLVSYPSLWRKENVNGRPSTQTS